MLKVNVLEYCHHLFLPPSPLFFLLSFIHSHLLPPPSQNHIEECIYRAVTCSNKECGVVLPYNQLESHEQTCPFRRVMCEYCDIEIILSQFEVRVSES